MIVGTCPPDSKTGEFHVWYDSVIIYPRTSSGELLPATLWQGIESNMSRNEIESLLAANLRTRQTYWSDFTTPLGRLRWSLDREFSGGDEAQIPRIYLYPEKLSLEEILDPGSVACLRKAAPKSKSVVVMRGKGQGQLATIVVNGLSIKQIIRAQAHR
jgi:hypothetical protein